MKTVITYGTFDLFHIGHLNLLQRLSDLGDRLVVGVSTDDFNSLKGKRSVFDFDSRIKIIAGLRCVNEVFPEHSWEQKQDDILKYDVSIFGMGNDWQGKFDSFNTVCKVVYLDRTENISTTLLKNSLSQLEPNKIEQLKQSLDDIVTVVRTIK